MKKVKSVLVVFLLACILLSMPQQAIANTTYKYESEAWKLFILELFTGADAVRYNPDLGATLERQIGVTLLINLSGLLPEVNKLSTAEINQLLSQFSDQGEVLDWARKYMAYAIKTGIVFGIGNMQLGPKNPLDGYAFATMVLRRLGFTVEAKDYRSSIQTLCNKAGLGQADVNYFNKGQLIKDDAIGMVYNALFVKCPNDKTWLHNLVDSGIVSTETAVALKLVDYKDLGRVDPDTTYVRPERPAGYQQAYNQLYAALSTATESINLVQNQYTDTIGELEAMVNLCLRENPDIMYYTSATYRSDGLLKLFYSKDKATILKHKADLEKKANAVLNEIIKPRMTPFEREKAVHDYLIRNCDYDFEGFENHSIKDEYFTAYGALCLGTAVCEGYSEAADILLNRSGVKSIIITGKSRGYGHAWNMVKLEGKYYHLDITWDDTVQLNEEGSIRYYYFNNTDKDTLKDHVWEASNFPKSTATKFNYYYYNNLVVSNRDAYLDKVLDEYEKGNKVTTYKILDTTGFDMEEVTDIIANRLFRGCSYSYVSEHQIAYVSID